MPLKIALEAPNRRYWWTYPGTSDQLVSDLKRGAVPTQYWPAPAPLYPPKGVVTEATDEGPTDGTITMRPAGFDAHIGTRHFTHQWRGFTSVALVRDGKPVGAWVTPSTGSRKWDASAFKKGAFPFFWADETAPSTAFPGGLWPVAHADCEHTLSFDGSTLKWTPPKGKPVSTRKVFRDRIAAVGDGGKPAEYGAALAAAGEPGTVRRSIDDATFSGVSAQRILDYRFKKGRHPRLDRCLVDASEWGAVFSHLQTCKVDAVEIYLEQDISSALAALAAIDAEPMRVGVHPRKASLADLDTVRGVAWRELGVEEAPADTEVPTWLLADVRAERLRLGRHVREGRTLKTTAAVLAHMMREKPQSHETIDISGSLQDLEAVADNASALAVTQLQVSGSALGDAAVPALRALLPSVRETLIVERQHLTADAIAQLQGQGPAIRAGAPWVDPSGTQPDPTPIGVPVSCLDTATITAWVRKAGLLLERRLTAHGLDSQANLASARALATAAVFQPITQDQTRHALALVRNVGSSSPLSARLQSFERALRQVSVDHQYHNWSDLPDVPGDEDAGMALWQSIEDDAYALDRERGGRELTAAILHLAEPGERDALRAELTG